MGRSTTGTLLGALAHEFRNPLASLHGCALTLLERRGDLEPEMQDGLIRVIVGQSTRLDWLIRAAAAYGGAMTRRAGDLVDAADCVREACSMADVKLDVDDGVSFEGDERMVRLALEALLVSLRGAGAQVWGTFDGSSLTVTSSARDLRQGERAWKLELARRLLKAEGCSIRITQASAGTRARVVFPDGEDE